MGLGEGLSGSDGVLEGGTGAFEAPPNLSFILGVVVEVGVSLGSDLACEPNLSFKEGRCGIFVCGCAGPFGIAGR